MFIDADLYSQIIQKIPIVCVDVLLRVDDEGYFLVQRASEPLKNEWWVVGGRKHLGEGLKEAANRILHQEIGDVACSIEIDNNLQVYTLTPLKNHLFHHIFMRLFRC